jgi:hypothetical protein
MKAEDLAVSRRDSWRNIAITLIDLGFGEQTAQACANACLRQLTGNRIE